ncbi:MAG: hypothetical protein EXS37_05220 [Opitutus sp.]|nr:hypothetical protein [Opitutus sp.]
MSYETGAVLDFYEDGLTALGALCARPWHDRLDVVAEGRAATLWNPEGALHAAELQFTAPDATGTRDAAREVFPGCPLTFRLAEALRPSSLPLERIVLVDDAHPRPPDVAVAEKLWRHQFEDTKRWRLVSPLVADFHFSLVVLARCEIQAIDQHWALCRVAVSLPDGHLDEGLAREIGFARASVEEKPNVIWPTPAPAPWSDLLQRALLQALSDEIAGIRGRQEQHLRRELDRIDAYFENYAAELTERARRGDPAKTADRLAATKAEHTRHRADQVARHEISVHPHLDALLLVAEPAWRAQVQVESAHHRSETPTARYVPRARRWVLAG